MKNFLECLGIAICLVAVCVCVRGCVDSEKPMFGVNGSIIATK